MSPLNDSKTEEKTTADELIAKGRRNLMCSEISNAVDCFQKACQMIAEEHGDLHESLAIPNLLYGTALLELARTENQILGGTVGQKEDGDSSVDEEKSENETTQDTCEANEEVESEETTKVDAERNVGQEETEKRTEESADQVAKTDSFVGKNDKEGDVPAEETIKDDDEEDAAEDVDDNEPVSTLQLAWEVVEVAKALFSKNADVSSQLKVADCLEKLAEIGCEKEDPQQAVNDLLECLSLRVKHASDNKRLIAETHFQLALAYSLANNKTSSDVSFGQALENLRNHKLDLEKKMDENPRSTDAEKDEYHVVEVQAKEVAQLIHEVAERQKENSEPVKTDVVFDKQQPDRKRMDENVPVADISHLIKKKRPSPEEPQIEGEKNDISAPAKKAKLDCSGDAPVSAPEPTA